MVAMDEAAATRRLDKVIDDAVQSGRIVGTVVLAAQDGRLFHERAAGFADREAAVPARTGTIFRLASVSKPIVTSLVMQQIEAERVGFDDAVTRFLPDFRPRLEDGSEPVITIRQLLTHSSGLGYRFAQPPGSAYDAHDVSDGLDQPGLGLAENLRRLSACPLMFVPGTRWAYSLGIDVLGGVVEQVLGQGLADAVQAGVTGPLGMTDTGFAVTDRVRLAVPYADGTPQPVAMTDGMRMALTTPAFEAVVRFEPGRILDAASYASGGAGMAGTAGDVLRFLEAIRTGGAPILQRDTVVAMMRDQFGTKAQAQGAGWGFGFGWGVLVDPGGTGSPQSAGTIQWGGAYGHSWFVDPVRRLTVVALTNTAFAGMAGRFPIAIRDAVYGGDGHDGRS